MNQRKQRVLSFLHFWIRAFVVFEIQISGKHYALSSNGLDLSALSLRFATPTEAFVQFTRLGEQMTCAVGLDGVERFSTDTFISLPFATKGRWLSEDSFLLQSDRVGGINRYDLTFKFPPDGATVSISIKEHTGLTNETFSGAASLSRG